MQEWPSLPRSARSSRAQVRDLGVGETVEVLEFGLDEAAQCQRAKVRSQGVSGGVDRSADAQGVEEGLVASAVLDVV